MTSTMKFISLSYAVSFNDLVVAVVDDATDRATKVDAVDAVSLTSVVLIDLNAELCGS